LGWTSAHIKRRSVLQLLQRWRTGKVCLKKQIYTKLVVKMQNETQYTGNLESLRDANDHNAQGTSMKVCSNLKVPFCKELNTLALGGISDNQPDTLQWPL
jgi:hypothetical protein